MTRPALRAATIFPIAALLLLVSCGEPPTQPTPPLSANVSAATSGYTLVDIGGTLSGAAAVSPNGQVVGSAFVTGKTRAVLWDDAVMTNLGDLGLVADPPRYQPRTANRAEATGINPSGQVVGNIYYPTSHRAFLWDKGVMTDLGSLGDAFTHFTYAYGINPAGQVVGQSYPVNQPIHAFLWENGVMTDLGVLSQGSESAALAISPSGVVVGYNIGFGFSSVKAVRWQNGVITDLGVPGAATATGINAAGQIVGYRTSALFSGPYFAFIWQDGVTTDLGTLGGANSSASGINGRGQVVGSSEMADGTYHAFVWEDGVMTDLGPGAAQGISANGTIVGVNNSGIAVMWRR
jgi:probable HAF family extracellular repeat protein